MKIINFFPILLIPISCISQNVSEKYIIDDDGISVEKNDSKKKYDEIAKITGENFNIFSIMRAESDEVRTHSRIIADFLNTNFYPVKFNAEEKKTIDFFCEL